MRNDSNNIKIFSCSAIRGSDSKKNAIGRFGGGRNSITPGNVSHVMHEKGNQDDDRERNKRQHREI